MRVTTHLTWESAKTAGIVTFLTLAILFPPVH